MQPSEAPPRHPIAFFFNFAFKLAALLWYMIGGFFQSKQFVANFVTCIVLLACDFWTVKNVSGRLLAGLRWWNDSTEAGSTWRFEVLQDGGRVVNPTERWWFWFILIGNPIIWVVFALAALFGLHLEYLLIDITAIILGTSNLVGYYKCSKDAKAQLQSLSSNLISRGFSAALNRV